MPPEEADDDIRADNAPDPVQEPPQRGYCVACRRTMERTWVTPNTGQRWCVLHLKEVFRRAWVGAPRV